MLHSKQRPTPSPQSAVSAIYDAVRDAIAIVATGSLCLTAATFATQAQAAEQVKPATAATRAANLAVLDALPFADRQDYDDAQRGWMGTLSDGKIRDAYGNVVWDLNAYAFLDRAQAPDTVNPSLWRQAQLNAKSGLFKVGDRIYQVRGFDVSNMTIIEGDTGLIVIDPLLSKETAHAALALYYQHRPQKPVVAVIYTHSHADHFGGVQGIVSASDLAAGKVKIYAPDGFMHEAVSENIDAGNAMTRRSEYMFGTFLPKNANGQVDTGLGKTLSLGTITLLPPTDIIKTTGETRTIDGVQVEFEMAPDTEAPAEMLMYFPQFKALCVAEDAIRTLHNLYTLRGAKTRDAAKWWRVLDETLDRYGDRSDVMFAQHTWPTWGQDQIVSLLANERDAYKYINDQTLRLINEGHTKTEVGEMVKLPPDLARQWYLRGYYGTVNHNAKAVYDYYMGWYSGNPADLYPLPPKEAAQRYVKFMGGAHNAIRQARDSYAHGDYRWVAEVMKQVVYADPHNQVARNLEADALEQLGYQAESGPWRNEFLSGALELRNGVAPQTDTASINTNTLRALSDEMFLDYLSIRLNGERAAGTHIALNWVQPDTGKRYVLRIENGVFLYKADATDAQADATLTITRDGLVGVLTKQSTLKAEIAAGHAGLDGNPAALATWLGLLDPVQQGFPIVAR
jgi:alkyl sulfatase BDS1-like metallo-beta-lactamase superfamily hydrolase